MNSLSFVSLEDEYTKCLTKGNPLLVSTAKGTHFVVENFFVRLFNRIFRRYSYDIICGSTAVILNAKNLLQSPTASIDELTAACKVINIAEKILNKSTKNSCLKQNAINACSETLDTLISSIATKENISKFDIYFRMGYKNDAYRYAKKHGLPEDLSSQSLEHLFKITGKKQDIQLGLQILEKRLRTKPLPGVLYSLTIRTFITQNPSLYRTAVINGYTEAVKIFLEEGAKPFPGELFTVLQQGNPELLSVLLQYRSPFDSTDSNTPPFKDFMQNRHLTPTDPEVEQLLREISTIKGEDFPQIPHENLFELEINFLTKSPFISPITQEAFNSLLTYLSKKYPKADFSEFLISSFHIIQRDPQKTLSLLTSTTKQKLLQLTYQKKEYDLLYALMLSEKSFESPLLKDPSFLSPIFSHAIKTYNVPIATDLLKKFPQLYENQNLFLKCAATGNTELVQAFLTQGKIKPDGTDTDGNTVLHHAFLCGNQELILLLFQYCNPIIENNNRQTPFEFFLKPPENYVNALQLTPQAQQQFIKNFFTRKEGEPQGIRAQNLHTIIKNNLYKNTSTELCELLFLLNHYPSSYSKDTITNEEFEKAIPFLTKKYPQYPLSKMKDYFFLSFQLNKNHLKTGCQRVIPQTIPKNTSLSSLKTLFKDMPWSEIDTTSLYEFVFEKPYDDTVGDIKTALYDNLRLLIRRVKNREAYLGTPTRGNALENFYGQIERGLRHSCATLLEQKDPEKTMNFMKEMLRATNYCGGRIFKIASDQYFHVCEQRSETPQEYLEIVLAEYRQLCFDGIIAELVERDVHAANRATKEMGKELGIPSAVSIFDDMFRQSDLYNPSLIKKTFFEKAYTPFLIVTEYLMPLFATDATARDCYIDLQKQHLPPDWKDEKYAPIYEEIEDLGWRKKTEQNILAILEKHDIVHNPKKTPFEDIEEDRLQDYLGSYVYDENSQLSYIAVGNLLSRIGVFTSVFPT